MFVDRVEIEIIAGKGGDGCRSFRREKHVPHGGPNGGDGGHGGSIIIRAREGVNSLMMFSHQKQWRAERGMPGTGSNCHGKSGDQLVLEVPPGTVVMDLSSGLVIKDLVNDGDEVVAARGGKGGWGNTHFKTSTNQAPFEFNEGQEGERRRIVLELKCIADVGLIGKPNAGKSTLLSRLSRARPEIADYPFTTKYPNLGLVAASRDRSFVMADIPGLIEGAHAGVGLGHDFLRHIVRAGILVHMVEPMPMDGTNPLENYNTIRSELSQYSQELSDRPEIIVVSKSELPGSDIVKKELEDSTGKSVMAISAVTGSGLDSLVRQVDQMLRDRQAIPAKSPA